MNTLLTIASMLCMSFAALPYIYDTIRGRVRPRLVSWAIWTVLAVILAVSSFADGYIVSGALAIINVIACGAILAFGWKQGSRTIGRLDIFCIIGAVVGISSLVVLRDPSLALVVTLVVDGIAFLPTLWHGWTDPSEESLACFAISAFGGGLALAAAMVAGETSIHGVLYPIYALVFDGLMALLILLGRINERTGVYGDDEVESMVE